MAVPRAEESRVGWLKEGLEWRRSDSDADANDAGLVSGRRCRDDCELQVYAAGNIEARLCAGWKVGSVAEEGKKERKKARHPCSF